MAACSAIQLLSDYEELKTWEANFKEISLWKFDV